MQLVGLGAAFFIFKEEKQNIRMSSPKTSECHGFCWAFKYLRPFSAGSDIPVSAWRMSPQARRGAGWRATGRLRDV